MTKLDDSKRRKVERAYLEFLRTLREIDVELPLRWLLPGQRKRVTDDEFSAISRKHRDAYSAALCRRDAKTNDSREM